MTNKNGAPPGQRELVAEFRQALKADIDAARRCNQLELARKQARAKLADVIALCGAAGIESDKLARESIRMQRGRAARLGERSREALRLRKIRSRRETVRHGPDSSAGSQRASAPLSWREGEHAMSKRLIRKTEYTEEYIIDGDEGFPPSESGAPQEDASAQVPRDSAPQPAEAATKNDNPDPPNESEQAGPSILDENIECCIAGKDGVVHCGAPVEREIALASEGEEAED